MRLGLIPLVLGSALVASGALAAPPVGVGGCGVSSPSRLLGFTQAQVLPLDGLFGMKRACANEFPGSHVCTSEEIIRSPANPSATGLVGNAWALPVFQPLSLTTGADSTTAVDASGILARPNELTCGAWSVGGRHLFVTSTLGFGTLICDNFLGVACCG